MICNFCHVFTSEVLFLVTGAIGLVISNKFGWNIMLMNTRYIIGIGIVHYILIFMWRDIFYTTSTDIHNIPRTVPNKTYITPSNSKNCTILCKSYTWKNKMYIQKINGYCTIKVTTNVNAEGREILKKYFLYHCLNLKHNYGKTHNL